MSFGVKTLLRAVCISAMAAAVVFMPAEAARKSRGHSATVSTRHAGTSKSSHGTHGGSQDRRHSRTDSGRQDSSSSHAQESRRGRYSYRGTSGRYGRRYSRYGRRSYNDSYSSDSQSSSFTKEVSRNIVGKSSHGYTPKATDIAMTAMSLIGTPYRFGGNSPLTGMDCSGFVRYVYKESLSTTLPRSAAEMSRVGQYVGRDELKPGDLVFYNTMRRPNSHVGIYLGDDKFIHSPRSGQRVRINSMNETYWRGRFNGARRIIGGSGIDRAKVLQQYSKEADTAPDSYNYSDGDDSSDTSVSQDRAEQSTGHRRYRRSYSRYSRRHYRRHR